MSVNTHEGHRLFVEYRDCTVSYRVDSVDVEADTVLINPDPLIDINAGPAIYCATCDCYVSPRLLGLTLDWEERNTA